MTLSPRQWVLVCVGVIMIPVSPALANGPLSSDGESYNDESAEDITESSSLNVQQFDDLKKEWCAKAISDAFDILGSKKKISYHPEQDALVYDDDGDLAIYTSQGKKVFKPEEMLCENSDAISDVNDAFADALEKVKEEWAEAIKDPDVHVGNLSGEIENLQLSEKCEGIAQAESALNQLQITIAESLRSPRSVASQGSSGSSEDDLTNSDLGTD